MSMVLRQMGLWEGKMLSAILTWWPYSSTYKKSHIGRIELSVSTASSTYELSEVTHLAPFCTYKFHSTGLCNYRKNGLTQEQLAVGTDSRSKSTGPSRSVFSRYGRVSHGLFPRVRKYDLLYLRPVKYDQRPSSVTLCRLAIKGLRMWNLAVCVGMGIFHEI